MRILLIVLGVFWVVAVFALDGKDVFLLKKTESNIELNTSSMTVKTAHAGFHFWMDTEFGKYSFGAYNGGGKVVLDKITVLRNDDVSKCVELVSKPFVSRGENQEFRVRLEVRKGCPLLFLRSRVINLGEKPAACYFSWSFPMKHDVCATVDGDTVVTSSHRKYYAEKWLYFPRDNQKGGLGLIIDGTLKNMQMRPHVNPKRIAWLIPRNPSREKGFQAIQKGESNEIDFAIMPAENSKIVEVYYERLGRNEIFQGFFKN